MQGTKNQRSKKALKPTENELKVALEGLRSLTSDIKKEIHKNQVLNDLEFLILAKKFARLHLNLESCKISFATYYDN